MNNTVNPWGSRTTKGNSKSDAVSSAGHASGPGKVIAVVYGIFTLSAGARACYQLIRKFDEAPLAILLSLLSAIIYAIAAVSLAKRGERARQLAVITIVAELLGVLGIGVFSYAAPQFFPLASVWSHFGQGYGYIPLVLPVVGLWWLYRAAHRTTNRSQNSR